MKFFLISSFLWTSLNCIFLLLILSKDRRLNNNHISGPIPVSLTNIGTLQVLWVNAIHVKSFLLYDILISIQRWTILLMDMQGSIYQQSQRWYSDKWVIRTIYSNQVVCGFVNFLFVSSFADCVVIKVQCFLDWQFSE